MAKEFKLTSDGIKRYEEELEFLKTTKRKEIAEKIKVALSFGDLSENSEYDEAKNEQAKVESKIAEIEVLLKNAVVIDGKNVSTKIVSIGSKVKVLDCEFNEDLEYRIVGASEASPADGLISDESPLGKKLLGCKVGDKVEVEVPAGNLVYEVKKISK